jgi:DNA polymerase-3 subunit delta'
VHPDVHVLSPKGASGQIPIDDVRQLLGRIALRPFSAKVQAAIIDGADRLTEEAANSLLKALEEPSATTRFVLTTSHLSDCLPTIVSRCQLVRCRPLPARVVSEILTRTDACEPPVAQAVARLCGGSVSHALELIERWQSSAEILGRLASGGPSAWMEQPMPEGREEVARLLDGLLGWLRDVTVAAAGEPDRIIHAEHAAAIARQARAVDVDRCLETAQELIALRESLEQFANARLVASLARERWLSLIAP